MGRHHVAGALAIVVVSATAPAAAQSTPADAPPLLPPPSSTSTEPSPAPPLEPPRYRPRRHEPPPPDESNFVTVTLEADKPGTWLEALTVHDGWAHVRGRWWAYGRVGVWHRVCEAPCTMRVPPDLRYRVGGPSVPASDAFEPGPPGGERRLHANAGSKGGQLGGAALVFLGVPTTIVGLVVTAESHANHTPGLVTMGVGVAATVIGAILIAVNGTSVYDASGRAVGSGSPFAIGF